MINRIFSLKLLPFYLIFILISEVILTLSSILISLDELNYLNPNFFYSEFSIFLYLGMYIAFFIFVLVIFSFIGLCSYDKEIQENRNKLLKKMKD
jgi:hypothetical protein